VRIGARWRHVRDCGDGPVPIIAVAVMGDSHRKSAAKRMVSAPGFLDGLSDAWSRRMCPILSAFGWQVRVSRKSKLLNHTFRTVAEVLYNTDQTLLIAAKIQGQIVINPAMEFTFREGEHTVYVIAFDQVRAPVLCGGHIALRFLKPAGIPCLMYEPIHRNYNTDQTLLIALSCDLRLSSF
jgi:hypothetical protein